MTDNERQAEANDVGTRTDDFRQEEAADEVYQAMRDEEAMQAYERDREAEAVSREEDNGSERE